MNINEKIIFERIKETSLYEPYFSTSHPYFSIMCKSSEFDDNVYINNSDTELCKIDWEHWSRNETLYPTTL